MFITKLAIKNLLRHRNRTLVTAIIIAFAIFYYILLDSMIGGMTQMSYQTLIDYEAGHLQVVQEAYWDEEEELPLEHLIDLDDEILTVIKGVPGHQGSSPELSFRAMLNNGINELPVVGKGIVPDLFGQVFALEDQYVEGTMFRLGQHQAVLGQRLADLMQLEVGDYITLLVRDKNKTFNTIDVEVAGLVHTSNPNVNSNYVYLPLDLVQQALNTDGQVSKVIVKLANANAAKRVAGELAGVLQTSDPRLQVFAWEDLEAVTVAKAKQAANGLILGIILIIAAIAIINTVILAALERMGEIGMMKALGMQTKEVVYTFVLESVGIGIIGGLVGVLFGVVGIWALNLYGLDYGAWFNLDMASYGIPIIGKMYGVWNPHSFVLVFGFGVLASLLASILPAYWAADKDPVKAIYHR